MESELLSAASSTLDTAILDLNLDASFIEKMVATPSPLPLSFLHAKLVGAT